jgi:uroporphyrin-III C-methyltransferase
LLTVKAVRAIRAATVLLVDDLVGDGVLRYARRSARIVHVGKRGGCRSTPQDFIERLMLAEAQRGERVVRLKGGDPFVFGRGGEELTALRAAGVEAAAVCGITAGLAAPAALGIPVTHRDAARGVTLLTGHARDGSTPDWRALRAAGNTLVIYMGMTRLGTLVADMLAAGYPADTPACAVQNATLPGQREIVAPLAGLPRAVAAAGLASPAIVVIGDVVRLASVALYAELAPRAA